MKASGGAICITRLEAALLVRLLGKLNVHLVSAIETACVPGERKAFEKGDREQLAVDRRNWEESERMIFRLISATRSSVPFRAGGGQ
jgi:hypothetical protein